MLSCTLVAPRAVSAAPAAGVEQDPAAKQLAEGRRQFAIGEFDAALKLLRKAAAATEEPKLLGQIHFYAGLAHAASGGADAAHRSFVKALEHDPTLRIDPDKFKPAFVEAFERARQQLQGVLEVETIPPDASVEVTIDGGQHKGRTPLRLKLAIGKHRVQAVADDGRGKRYEVLIKPHGVERIALSLAGLTPGKLAVASRPDTAAVWIDGRRLGQTPLAPASMQAGRHRLIVTRSGYRAAQRQVWVDSGATRKLSLTLHSGEGSAADRARWLLPGGTRAFRSNLAVGPGFALHNGVTMISVLQEFAYHLYHEGGGPACGVTIGEAFGDGTFQFQAGPRFWWFFQPAPGIGWYLAPSAYLGYLHSAVEQLPGQDRVIRPGLISQVAFGTYLLFRDRISISFRPLAISVIYLGDLVAVRYGLYFGVGVSI